MSPQQGPAVTPGQRLPDDGLIHWELAASEVDLLVRAATHPNPGAFTFWRSRRLYVWAGEPVRVPGPPRDLPPGTILTVEAEGLVIMTGQGAYRILRCQPEGDDEVSGGDFGRDQAVGPGGYVGADS